MAGSTVGTRVGPYTLVEEIGQGGFATVWLATDQEGNRVAIKRFEADHGKEVDRERRLTSGRALSGWSPQTC